MSTQHIDWPEWVNSGLAFFAAIVGWVWHAGRLATRVDETDRKVEAVIEEANDRWTENNERHREIMDKIDNIASDVAYMRGNLGHKQGGPRYGSRKNLKSS